MQSQEVPPPVGRPQSLPQQSEPIIPLTVPSDEPKLTSEIQRSIPKRPLIKSKPTGSHNCRRNVPFISN